MPEELTFYSTELFRHQRGDAAQLQRRIFFSSTWEKRREKQNIDLYLPSVLTSFCNNRSKFLGGRCAGWSSGFDASHHLRSRMQSRSLELRPHKSISPLASSKDRKCVRATGLLSQRIRPSCYNNKLICASVAKQFKGEFDSSRCNM